MQREYAIKGEGGGRFGLGQLRPCGIEGHSVKGKVGKKSLRMKVTISFCYCCMREIKEKVIRQTKDQAMYTQK